MHRTLALLLLGGPLYAAELPDCAHLADPSARLACYDAWAAGRQTAAVVTAPAAAAPATVITAAPAAPLSAEQKFGIESQIAKAEQADEIRTRFLGRFNGWEPKQKFTFENGQVWQIADGSSGHYVVENPEITISRGMFSAFFLHVEGLNKAPKVKRLK
jgi:hypothetical protein